MQSTIVKTIIFDLDGTLFQADKLAIPAFHDTLFRLKAEGLFDGQIPKDEVLKSMFGKTNMQIWAELLPEVQPTVVQKADEYMLYYELLRINRGEGRVYPGVTEVLHTLSKKGYRLCIASNGGEDYVTGVCQYYFPDLFAAVYSAGGYQTSSKAKLVTLIIQRFNDAPLIMVGDRLSDIEAGKKNGLMTVGCSYGFGKKEELEGADFIITDFRQILDVI